MKRIYLDRNKWIDLNSARLGIPTMWLEPCLYFAPAAALLAVAILRVSRRDKAHAGA